MRCLAVGRRQRDRRGRGRRNRLQHGIRRSCRSGPRLAVVHGVRQKLGHVEPVRAGAARNVELLRPGLPARCAGLDAVLARIDRERRRPYRLSDGLTIETERQCLREHRRCASGSQPSVGELPHLRSQLIAILAAVVVYTAGGSLAFTALARFGFAVDALARSGVAEWAFTRFPLVGQQVESYRSRRRAARVRAAVWRRVRRGRLR